MDEIKELRYRERFSLSAVQMMNEPAEEVRKAMLIWELDAEFDKLRAERLKNV